MSKRNLIIIIVLLVIVDIAAGLWYMALRIETSGESHDLWNTRDSAAVLADTLATTSLPDSFAIMQFSKNFVSEKPAIAGNLNSYYVCVKRVRVRWPESVNGNDSLPALERALLAKLFGGNTGGDLATSARQWLKEPRFTQTSRLEYRQIETTPKLVGNYAHAEHLMAYPLLTSLRLLVMQVEHRTHHGERNTATYSYVHYDRIKQTVLSRANILEPSKERDLLMLINNKIERLNSEKGLHLERANKVANEFHATRAGIVFEYPAGEVAVAAEGNTDILVEYPQLSPVLTREFKNLLNLNDGYWKYKPLEPKL